MAEFPGRCLIGEAIAGHEFIYPKVLWEPEQINTKRGTVYFTHLVKGVDDVAKQGIMKDGGFIGRSKTYDENEFGGEISATFTWWSVYIDDTNATIIKTEADSRGQEIPDIYKEGNRFGSNMFTERLDDLITYYENCINGRSEIRVLSTFVYTREIQHSVVVVPENHKIFQHHDLFASKDGGGGYSFKMNHIMKDAENGDGYVWYPFSTVQWDNYSPFPKQRYYAHLAFAFYLDPLPGKFMFVPSVEKEAQWKTFHSGFVIG